MNLASLHLQGHPIQDRLALNGRMQIIDFEERLGVGTNHVRRKGREKRGLKGWRWDYPTEPSSLRARSLSASAANSMGSWLNTSLQKPLTIIDTASSKPMPRL